MFLLTKFLIKYIVIPVLISMIIPIILLIFMYQPMNFYYTDSLELEDIIVEEVIQRGFEQYQDAQDPTLPLVFRIEEEQLNYYMKEALSALDETQLDGSLYFIEEDRFGYAGSWFIFNEDEIELVSKLDVFVTDTITYETSLRLIFQIEFDGSDLTLNIKNMYIGNLPILWIFDVASGALNLFGIDLESEISTILSQFGTYNQQNKSLTIALSNLIESSVADQNLAILLQVLIENIQQNDLIDLSVSTDAGFAFNIELSKLYDDSEMTQIDLGIPLNIDTITEQWVSTISYMDVFQSILNTAETSSPTYNVTLEIETLNQMLVSFTSSIVPIEIELTPYQLTISHPVLHIETGLLMLIPFEITHQDQVIFQTIFKIETSIEYQDQQGYLTLNALTIGESTFNEAFLEQLLVISGVNVTNNQIPLDTVLSSLESVVSIAEVTVVDNGVMLLVQPEMSVPLTESMDQVEQMIEGLTALEGLPDDIQEALLNISQAIDANNLEQMNSAFEEYSQIYEALDDTIKSDIEAIIFDYIEDVGYLETLLN